MTSFGLYIHIPFCVKKCGYCDFLSFAACERPLLEKYSDSLIAELANFTMPRPADTVFIGGGTPTVLPADLLELVLTAVRAKGLTPGAEWTVEANPGTLDIEKLAMLRQCGVNRLSLGLQAWQDHLLLSLSRIHNRADFLENLRKAREAGFDNINADLMFGLPGQSMDDWAETLDNLVKLGLSHLSCYSLTVEDGTPFGELRASGALQLPDEDTEREMYHLACEKLEMAGYRQYELSNWALPGCECRHNLHNWRRMEYKGFGLGAHSLLGNVRWMNPVKIEDYCAGREPEALERLSRRDEMAEEMILGLRLTEGVSGREFYRKYETEMEEVYAKIIEKQVASGLLEWGEERPQSERHLRLTARGKDLANVAMGEFL